MKAELSIGNCELRNEEQTAAQAAAESRARSNAAVGLRAAITQIEIMGAMFHLVLEDGQRAMGLLPKGADTTFVEKLRTQLLHTTNLIANAQLALPSIPEIQRHIEKLSLAPGHLSLVAERKISSDFGDQVRSHDHGQNKRAKECAA